MRIRRLGLWILIALAGAAGTVNAAGEPKEMPFRLYEGFAIIVQGEIGDLHNLNFMIDTGAVPSVVNRRTAEKLRLKGVAEKNFSVLNQTVQVERIVLPELRLGSLRAEALPVVVLDLSTIEQSMGARIDAIIGLDVMGRANFTIDYQKKKIFIGTTVASGASVPFEVHHEAGAPYVVLAMEVNGRRLQLLVDTGTNDLKLFSVRTGEATVGLRTVRNNSNLNPVGTDTLREVRLAEVRLGAEVFRKQKAYLWDSPTSVLREFDGLLGPVSLGLVRIAFDFEHGRLTCEKQ